ncbi:MAG: N-acetyl-alpha-D-glucosaminyl L-malate synthase BshA [Burkholderiales bacterium]|nr:N-acetyl-alpha-D-glucosaminyl L-malate synthase BshA [Burkholderiales bacterium]
MRIGIACHATIGGSGAIAASLGKLLADEGHEIHFVCNDVPFGIAGSCHPGITVHKADATQHPPLKCPPHGMALAVKMASVSRHARLDVFHVHYAIPYALSAYLARAMIAPERLRIVCTVHGTDITLVGADPSYKPLVQFLLRTCDAVTAVSQWLAMTVKDSFKLEKEISCIYNFIDADKYRPLRADTGGVPTLAHISNFRPVKRTADVIEIFKRVRDTMRARLIMVGDGPDKPRAESLARTLGIVSDVTFVGETDSVVDILSSADVFLLPSEMESFGLAALEAMACEVPVVGSDVGGLNEVVEHGESGYLLPTGDVESMAAYTLKILGNQDLRTRLGKKGRSIATEKFRPQTALHSYLQVYESVLK